MATFQLRRIVRTPSAASAAAPRPGGLIGGRASAAIIPLLLLATIWAAACGGAPSATRSATPLPPFLPTLPGDRPGRALSAFDTAFYVQTGDRAYDRLTTAGGRADFWTQAEMIEMVEDAYQTSPQPVYKNMVLALQQGVAVLWGGRWTRRAWNDDIMWMTIASVRAYDITGKGLYLRWAKRNFDAVYARAWDAGAGGGLAWIQGSPYRNMTTNGPATIAASMLSRDLNDPTYLAKATRIYSWMRATLWDAKTGAVADGITGTTVRHVDLAYNYGTMIGAADQLYGLTHDRRYYDDALRTLRHARAVLTTPGGILKSEANGTNANLGGLNGIFARWAVRFTTDNHLSAYDPWFRKNAHAAWSHRNAQGLMGSDWTRQTRAGVLRSFDCSAGVVMVVVAPRG